MTRRPVLVMNVVGLTPRLLEHMPRLRAVGEHGFQAELTTVLPAVTCTVQSTMLTGLAPADHGIVGNGWYFRDLGEVLLWRQSNRLVEGEKVWETARRTDPDFTTANICWWYAMAASTDLTVTPRPIYHADGRKSPDCYTVPTALHDRLQDRLGPFPLFNYWGPTAGIASSEWIAEAARHVIATDRPDLTLVYLPHLDYDLQRFGPDGPEAIAAAKAIDEVAGGLAEDAQVAGVTVIVVSEYGITSVQRPIDINRHLRRNGLLEVYTQAGMEYLDPWTSRAFAVSDHQLAHVYVRDPADIAPTAALLADLPGVAQVLDAEGIVDAGLGHPRSGELVVVAEANAWFTYYYWLDDADAPDFARTVDIHRKPGYDPAELFFDPSDRAAKAKAGLTLAKRKLGFRGTLNVVPLDPSYVSGSHGRLPESPADGPVLMCSDDAAARSTVAAHEVKQLILDSAGIGTRVSP